MNVTVIKSTVEPLLCGHYNFIIEQLPVGPNVHTAGANVLWTSIIQPPSIAAPQNVGLRATTTTGSIVAIAITKRLEFGRL